MTCGYRPTRKIARDEEQLDVYETPFDESLFVVGPPGSGKTVLAVHRAQMLVECRHHGGARHL